MVNAAAQYRELLKKELRCGQNVKNRLLAVFDRHLDTYLEDHAEPSLDELVSAFGPPEGMAEILMEEVTSKERKQYERTNILKTILGIILAVALLFASVYIWFYKETGLTSEDSIYETTDQRGAVVTPGTEVP